jgi:uncharacterized membrane protein
MGAMRASRHLIAIIAAYAVSAAVYTKLPAVPLTYGTVRPMIAFLLPTAALATYVLLRVIWTRDPFRPRDENGEAIYDAIVFRMVLFILGVHAAVLIGLLTFDESGPSLAPVLARAVPVLLGLAFVSIGNLLPRLRPNAGVGIRTSAALADRGVWMQVNRFAGYVAVALGSVLALTGALLPPGPIVGNIAGFSFIVAAAVLFVYARKYSRA